MIESHASEHGEVRGKELNESEPSDEASLAKIGHIKTEGQVCPWDNGRGNLFTDCWVCGVKVASARPLVALLRKELVSGSLRNVRSRRGMRKENTERDTWR